MNSEIKYYEEFVKSFSKLSINEFERLLRDGSREARNQFLMGFMPYIYRIAVKIYCLNEKYFNAYYDFEELFNDGIMLTMNLFMQGKFKDNFNNFENYFRLLLLRLVANTYFMKVHKDTWIKICDIIDASEVSLDIKEIKEITGYSDTMINNAKTCEYLKEDTVVDEYQIEEVLDKVILSYIKKDLHASISKLPFVWQEIVRNMDGIGCPIMKAKELGENYGVTRQEIERKHKKALRKIYEDNLNLQKYLS